MHSNEQFSTQKTFHLRTIPFKIHVKHLLRNLTIWPYILRTRFCILFQRRMWEHLSEGRCFEVNSDSFNWWRFPSGSSKEGFTGKHGGQTCGALSVQHSGKCDICRGQQAISFSKKLSSRQASAPNYVREVYGFRAHTPWLQHMLNEVQEPFFKLIFWKNS